MAKKKFICSKCGRRFVMKAHLGRHMSAAHQSGRSTTTRSTSRGKRRSRPSDGGMTMGGGVAFDGSAQFVVQMQECRRRLLAQRAALDAQIDALDTAMRALSGASSPQPAQTPRRAPQRRGSGPGSRPAAPLKESIVKVLRRQSKPMSPSEIAVALKKTGFKSAAKDLAKSVSNRLAELKNVKRVGTGLYRM